VPERVSPPLLCCGCCRFALIAATLLSRGAASVLFSQSHHCCFAFLSLSLRLTHLHGGHFSLQRRCSYVLLTSLPLFVTIALLLQ
ncbi:hypothetical protein S245_039783, partial [Arachis hypogaea]